MVKSVVSFHLMPKDLFVAIVCWLPLELIAWSLDQFVWLMLESPHCSSSILCCKLMCLPGLLSTFRIVWVATTPICLLLHLVRTLTPLLSSGLFSPLLPNYNDQNPLISIISWPLILKQSDQSLVFLYNDWITWLHSQWFPSLKTYQPK